MDTSSEAGSSSLTSLDRRKQFDEKVRQSKDARQAGNWPLAIRLYTEALQLDKRNHYLYTHRSAAYLELADYAQALRDAQTARQYNPQYAKAYLKEGVALRCLDRHSESLAALAAGLAEEPKSAQLLTALVEAAKQAQIKDRFTAVYTQLECMNLSQSPFVLLSVIGQELLSIQLYQYSVQVLESALRIGSCSLKLRGSVFSALATAHWANRDLDKAIACMLQDLAIVKALGDQEGECRSHGNLGSAYHSKGHYREALTHQRCQLVLAMRLKQKDTAASALSSLGHVYTAIGDYPNALSSHKQCVITLKQCQDKLREAREIGNVGAVYLAMGDFDSAVECHQEHLKVAKHANNLEEEARAYSNLGSAYHYKRCFTEAVKYHNQVLSIAEQLGDKVLELRAYAGLGHAARCMEDYIRAKECHEKQLDNALSCKDRVAEGRACSNLGIILQHLGEYEAALKLQKAHLKIAKDLGDRAAQGRAFGNQGNAYSSMGQYEMAIKFHKQELYISKEVSDRHAECSTHGNLAVAYQAKNMYDKALQHYTLHLKLSRELRDPKSESRALSNLGNFHCSQKNFTSAVPLYQQFLSLVQELGDTVGESQACHKLGYVHYCLGQFKESIRYYQQDLAIANDLKDTNSLCRALCNLGLAHKALGELTKALDYQKRFLASAHSNKNFGAKFTALGNIGDILVKQGEVEESVKFFNQQLTLAKGLKERSLEAIAHGNLGSSYRILTQLDTSLAHHNQELAICKEIDNTKGQCKAYGHLGNVYLSIGQYQSAYQSYEDQLQRARQLGDVAVEAQAFGNLGISKMNLGQLDDAVGMFEQQLALLDQLLTTTASQAVRLDKGRALGNLGDCQEALGEYEEAVRYQEQYLSLCQSSQCTSIVDQDRAYRGLGNAHRAMGNLQQALVCFEKRLVAAHELGKPAAKGSAYGELGCLHSLLGNFEQAIKCLRNQLDLARQIGDKGGEADAACGLGGVYQQMGDYKLALQYHQIDYDIAEKSPSTVDQCRACGNLGLSHESLGNFQQAINYQEQHLSIAAQNNDRTAKTLAYSSLGRVHHALGNYSQAVQYLQQGLSVAEQSGKLEDEAKIRHRLGLALWGNADHEASQQQLYRAVELFETIRRETQISSDYRLSLYDLQTASYQALQRVLVALGRTDEALVVAERGRTRAFIDLLLERQHNGEPSVSWCNGLDYTPVTLDYMLDIVSKQPAAVLYYSLAAGYLYSWLITPKKGVIKFSECSINDLELPLGSGGGGGELDDTHSIRSLNASSTSLLDYYVGNVRESLGVETHNAYSSRSSFRTSSSGGSVAGMSIGSGSTSGSVSGGGLSAVPENMSDSESDDMWHNQMSELGGRLNADNDTTGFLRLVNRNHLFNCSSYSLSSLLSLGSNSTITQHSAHTAASAHSTTPGNARASTRSNASMHSRTSANASIHNANDASNVTPNRASIRSNKSNVSVATTSGIGSSTVSSSSNRSNGSTAAGTTALGSTNGSSSSKAALSSLYDLLIAPMEDCLRDCDKSTEWTELVIVPQGDLYLVPFAVLRSTQAAPCLYERFSLIAVPSLRALQASHVIAKHNKYNPDCSGAVVVGNPLLPQCVIDQWQWLPIPGAESECRSIGEMLSVRPLVRDTATKHSVLQQVQRAEVVHLATHVSWKLAAIVLAPGGDTSASSAASSAMQHENGHIECMDLNHSTSSSASSSDLDRSFDGPPLTEYLLTAADILNMKLTAKLVVLSSGHSDDRAGRVNSDGVVGLTRAILAAGAQCVLFSLWPVPEPASKLFMKSFYTLLLQGIKTSQALSESMRSVENSRQFSDASNWAGWVLVGSDVTLSSKVALMGHALCQLLRQPNKSREAIRVVLHLVEKSLQRIHNNHTNAMYTTQASIENKVGDTHGWIDLLKSVGFRFEPGMNDLPASVFFPLSDPGERLTQCSASLQALLGLSVPTLTALSKMIDHQDVGEAVTALIRAVNSRFSLRANLEMKISVKLWRSHGCHEFLASIGFDLVDVGKSEVTVRAGKQANHRTLQFAQQALVAVFDTQKAPRSLLLESSSSLESLASSESATSTSNYTPPASPSTSSGAGAAVGTARHRGSFFNPAEVDKLPSAAGRHPRQQMPASHASQQLHHHTAPPHSSVASSSPSALPSQPAATSPSASPGNVELDAREGARNTDEALSVQLVGYQTDIRHKYSSSTGGGSASDTSSCTTHDETSIEIPSPNRSSGYGDNVWESYGDKSDSSVFPSSCFIPTQPPINVYSTSASESEDNAATPTSRLSRTHSRSSNVSGASGSTHTTVRSGSSSVHASSGGGGGGGGGSGAAGSFGGPMNRRHRSRSSVNSVRSVGSDRSAHSSSTTTRSVSRERVVVDVSKAAPAAAAPVMKRPPAVPHKPQRHAGNSGSDAQDGVTHANDGSAFRKMSPSTTIGSTRGVMTPKRLDVSVYNTHQEDGSGAKPSAGGSHSNNDDVINEGSMNPTEVAQKVLAETWQERRALELMQKQSVQELALRHASAIHSDTLPQGASTPYGATTGDDDTSSLEAVTPIPDNEFEDAMSSPQFRERIQAFQKYTSNSGRSSIASSCSSTLNRANAVSAAGGNISDRPPSYTPPKIPDYNSTVASATTATNVSSVVAHATSPQTLPPVASPPTAIAVPHSDSLHRGAMRTHENVESHQTHHREFTPEVSHAKSWYESDDSESPIKPTVPPRPIKVMTYNSSLYNANRYGDNPTHTTSMPSGSPASMHNGSSTSMHNGSTASMHNGSNASIQNTSVASAKEDMWMARERYERSLAGHTMIEQVHGPTHQTELVHPAKPTYHQHQHHRAQSHNSSSSVDLSTTSRPLPVGKSDSPEGSPEPSRSGSAYSSVTAANDCVPPAASDTSLSAVLPPQNTRAVHTEKVTGPAVTNNRIPYSPGSAYTRERVCVPTPAHTTQQQQQHPHQYSHHVYNQAMYHHNNTSVAANVRTNHAGVPRGDNDHHHHHQNYHHPSHFTHQTTDLDGELRQEWDTFQKHYPPHQDVTSPSNSYPHPPTGNNYPPATGYPGNSHRDGSGGGYPSNGYYGDGSYTNNGYQHDQDPRSLSAPGTYHGDSDRTSSVLPQLEGLRSTQC